MTSTHFNCHRRWGRYASDRPAARQLISILAEALGCDHPEPRASRALPRRSRRNGPVNASIWITWGLSDAGAIIGGLTGCSCDVHKPRDIIPIDVVRGISPGLTRT